MALHKAWMMRSYGFTLIFVLSRVPDAFIAHYSDQFLGDMLWSLVVVALIAPEVIMTTQTLLKIRSAKARHASARRHEIPGRRRPAARNLLRIAPCLTASPRVEPSHDRAVPAAVRGVRSAPADTPQPPQRSCVRAAGSEIVICGTPPQQGMYRIPRLPPKTYGPPLPSAQAVIGHGVSLRGQANNSGRRHRSAATLSVPF